MRVTILSGFLGSGKTTLLRRLLREQKSERIAVIVNDMAELEVDGDLVRSAHRLSEKVGNMVSLFAGSLGGDQREAFAQALEAWKRRADIEHLVIETSGSTHPWPLIEEITHRPEYRLDTFVTLLDAKAFIEDFGAGRLLFQRLIENQDRGVRSMVNLLAEQIQVASVILLTKIDRVAAEDLPFVIKCLEILNPHAAVHPVTYGQIPKARLLSTGSFSLDRAKVLGQAWHERHSGDLGLASAYDIGSTVICDPRPFHPRRLWTLFRTRLGQGIHRSKGFIWLASRGDQVLLWNQAAGSIDLELLAYWKAAIVQDPLGKLQSDEKEQLKKQLASSHCVFGDRLNELTIIGTTKDRERFVRELHQCFCTQAEVDQWQRGHSFEDPWPKELRRLN